MSLRERLGALVVEVSARAGSLQAIAGLVLLAVGVGWMVRPAAGLVAAGLVLLGDYGLERIATTVRAVRL